MKGRYFLGTNVIASKSDDGAAKKREAALIQAETGYRLFDSLIVAAAIAAGAETLYSEDLRDGRLIRGVRIRNPFRRITT